MNQQSDNLLAEPMLKTIPRAPSGGFAQWKDHTRQMSPFRYLSLLVKKLPKSTVFCVVMDIATRTLPRFCSVLEVIAQLY